MLEFECWAQSFTGAYGGYQMYATAANTVLAARQNTDTGLTGPEYQLAPTVLNPTTFFGSTGATFTIQYGTTGSTGGSLISEIGLTPTVDSHSYINSSITIVNDTNVDTLVSIYQTINGSVGHVTSALVPKKSGSTDTYVNVSTQERTELTSPAGVLITGSVYVYQSITGAAYVSSVDNFAMTNLG